MTSFFVNIRKNEPIFLQSLIIPRNLNYLIECLPTGWTLVRGIFHMQDPVDSQRPGLAEPFATIVTFERLLFGVNVSVVSQVVLPSKGLAANITVERSLIGVRSLVDEQVVRFGEFSLAELTNVAFLWL